MLSSMNTPTRALVIVVLTAAAAPAADPPKAPVDTSFLKEFAETRGYMLGRPQKPKFTPDGKTVLFLRAEAKSPKMKLFEFDVATAKTKELLSPEALLNGGEENLTPEEKARRERQRVSVGGFTDFHLDKEGKNVLVAYGGKLHVLDRGTGKATGLKTGTDGAIVDPKWSPDGKLIAYVRGFDVYVYDLATGKESGVTTGGTAIKTHGLAEFVAQEEMARHSGFWWSPDSKFIAYEEADHTGVETWYVADPLKPDQKPAEQFYPRPGKRNVAVRLGIIPVTSGETMWVEWDREKYEYLARVAWDVGGLLVIVQSRNQREVAFSFADPRTGKIEVAHRSRATDGWLQVPSQPLFAGPEDDLDAFLMIADDDQGESRLMQISRNNGGRYFPFRSVALLAAPKNRKRVYLTKSGDIVPAGPPTQHVHFFNFERPDERFTWDPPAFRLGVHTATFSEDDSVMAITSTSLDCMPVTRVSSGMFEFRFQYDLPSVALEPPFKPNVKIEKVGDYWTAIVRPRDFDPKKNYPVIVDVYGGPKHLHVVQAMRNWLVPQWLADQGFIVIAIDNRGTPGRGRDWERAIYQKFGTVPLEDQVKGLHALCDKYPEMDRDRVGIVGWSFGGYMAANGVLRRPDVFKVAVAGAPVTDWEDYDTHYTERYMGLLPESRKAYDEASLIPLAKDLKRPLLLVHGTADDNVYYRHTLKLSNALFRAGKDFEVLALPGITHMSSADAVVMERLWAKTATFFKAHLGGPKQ